MVRLLIRGIIYLLLFHSPQVLLKEVGNIFVCECLDKGWKYQGLMNLLKISMVLYLQIIKSLAKYEFRLLDNL